MQQQNELPNVRVPNSSLIFLILISLSVCTAALGQTPTPTPDNRGLGVQNQTAEAKAQAEQQAREAKPELIVQAGYSSLFGATRMVFSPDGRLMATGAFRSTTVKLWETATNRKLRELSSNTQSSWNIAPMIAFSRDSRMIAAASGNNTVKVWDVNSGREIQTLTGPQGSIMSSFGIYFLAFTADNRVITLSDSLRIWDIGAGKELRTIDTGGLEGISGFSGTDGAMTLSPDGTQLAMAVQGTETAVRILDLNTGKEIHRYNLPDKQLDSLQVAYTSDAHIIAAGVDQKKLTLWDLTAKTDRILASTQKEYGTQIKLTRDGRYLALSENYSVQIFEVASGKEFTRIKVPNSGTFSSQGADAFVSFSEDAKTLATGGFDTPTIMWDINGKEISRLSGRTNLAYDVAFSADGNQLASGGRTRWDLRTGRGLRVLNSTAPILFGIPSPDGKIVVVNKANTGNQDVVEAQSGRLLFTLTAPGDAGMVIKSHFSNDGTMLVTTYGPRVDSTPAGGMHIPTSVKIWDIKNGKELQTLAATESPQEARFTNDGRTVGLISSSGQITLWDVATGQRQKELTTSPMSKLQNLGNFGNIASIRNAQLPNMADMSQIITNTMGSMSAGTMGKTVTSLAFTPDGRMLATGGVESKSNFDLNAMMTQAQKGQKKGSKTPDPADIMKDFKVEAIGVVKLWDPATGVEVGSIKGHGKGINQVAFSRDGRLLATASTDNTIKIWEVSSQRELFTLKGHTANIDSIDFSPDARLIASAAEDGSTFLWDAKTGEHLLTMISLDEGDEWMVVTPQGLFDGTPVSWNQILWRYNGETFNVAPIEWFFNEFYYPGLLSDIFLGKRPRVAQDVSKKDRRQPVVKLILPGDNPGTGVASRTVKIRIDVADAPPDRDNSKGSGAQDVRLFRNGSLVKVWRGDVLKGQNLVSLEQEIAITAGPNQFVAYAFNKDNVKSKDSALTITGADSLKRKGTAYILAVGVNEYANSQYNLKYAVADAQSFADEVRAKQTQLGGFEKIEVVSLINENATKANLLGALQRLNGSSGPPSLKSTLFDNLKRAEPEDTVIVYFAGHGTAQAQRFYLIPHDLGYTGDRTKLTEEGLKTILSHSISDLEIEQAVESIDANHMVLVIDACNSGQALEAEEKRRGPMNSKGLAQLAYEKGMYILTAAQSFQAALEAAQLGHGLLTYALVEEGLKTPVADNEPKDGLLMAREWLDFATDRVPQMQQQKMNEGRGIGLAFTNDEKDVTEPDKRMVQRPRVFYRREMEVNPLVIAKP